MGFAWEWPWCTKLQYISEFKIVIYGDVTSGGTHHFTWKCHVMWHSQVYAQYLEYIKSPFV